MFYQFFKKHLIALKCLTLARKPKMQTRKEKSYKIDLFSEIAWNWRAIPLQNDTPCLVQKRTGYLKWTKDSLPRAMTDLVPKYVFISFKSRLKSLLSRSPTFAWPHSPYSRPLCFHGDFKFGKSRRELKQDCGERTVYKLKTNTFLWAVSLQGVGNH